MPNVIERKRISNARDVDGLYRGGHSPRRSNICLGVASGEVHHYIPVPQTSVLALVKRLSASRGEYLEAMLDEDYVWLNVRREIP